VVNVETVASGGSLALSEGARVTAGQFNVFTGMAIEVRGRVERLGGSTVRVVLLHS
jgi:hypothetical protein